MQTVRWDTQSMSMLSGDFAMTNPCSMLSKYTVHLTKSVTRTRQCTQAVKIIEKIRHSRKHNATPHTMQLNYTKGQKERGTVVI